jgi:hypothetical protein
MNELPYFLACTPSANEMFATSRGLFLSFHHINAKAGADFIGG